MKRTVWRILAIGCAAVLILTLVVPVAVPPIVKSVAETKLAELGCPCDIDMTLGYSWNKGPEIAGALRASVKDAPWMVSVEFGAGFGTYHAQIKLPKTTFSETDPLLAKILAEHPPAAISNLTFSGSIALAASVERTRRMPVPIWKVSAPIVLDTAVLTMTDWEITGSEIKLTPEVSGIADHADITPIYLYATSLATGGFSFTNAYAAVRASQKGVLVTEAGATTCGGKVNLYSLFLDAKSLNAGVTLFVDNINAGEMLTHIKGFSGTASGRLHGKVRLFVKEGGKAIRLGDAFLYSTPGEIGKLKMSKPETVTDNLSLAGIDQTVQDDVADALTDLDYSVLRFDLKRLDGQNATLGVRIDGSATRGKLTVPVNLNININGKLEQIVNTGLGCSRKLKGKAK